MELVEIQANWLEHQLIKKKKTNLDLLLLNFIISSSCTTKCVSVSVSVEFYFQVVRIKYVLIVQSLVWKQLISYLVISCSLIILTITLHNHIKKVFFLKSQNQK